MVKLKEGNINTELKFLDNGWVKLLDDDGYIVYLKTFKDIDGSFKTLYLDNFSVSPASINDYKLDDLIIDQEWLNLHENELITLDIYGDEKGIFLLKEYLPKDFFEEVKDLFYSELYSD